MNFIFFTRASDTVGLGHFERCITLAEALLNAGHQLAFLCFNTPQHLVDWLSTRTKALVLSESLNTSELIDENIIGNIFGKLRAELSLKPKEKLNWVIFDSYQFDENFEKKCRAYASFIMVIDDLPSKHHDCDVLLDQSYEPGNDSRYEHLLPRNCVTLLGPQFALLRPAFGKLHKSMPLRTGNINTILVNFGGADPFGDTLTALSGVAKTGKQYNVQVVTGAANMRHEEVSAYCRKLGFNHFHKIANMAEKMSEADLFIGTGGITTWERLCLKLPSIVISIAENHRHTCEILGRDFMHFYIGERELVTPEKICSSIQLLEEDKNLYQKLSYNAGLLVDGAGAERVCNVLTGFKKEVEG